MKVLPSCVDYITSIETPQLLKAEELRDGMVVSKSGKPLRYAGGFCVVFPFHLQTGKKVAVRCWTAYVPDAEKRTCHISTQIRESRLPYFVGFEYVHQGIATSQGISPIVIMDWVDAMPLKDYIKENLTDSKCISALADNFLQMAKDLHNVGFSHGDLQHGNIMVDKDGRLYLVDYDSMFVPGLENVTDEIKGMSGYQHPGRYQQEYLNPKSDYFSELIIYTSILTLSKYPNIWSELSIADTETMVFSQEDLDFPHRSNIFKRLKEDSQIAHCIVAIESALQERDINKLHPLEEAIIPETTRIIEGLQTKWKPRPIQEPIAECVNLVGLKEKWDKSPKEQVVEQLDIMSITNKWKG